MSEAPFVFTPHPAKHYERVACFMCHGRGRIATGAAPFGVVCPHCAGEGEVLESRPAGDARCGFCDGPMPCYCHDEESPERVAQLEAEFEQKLADDEAAFEEQYAAEHPDDDYLGRPR